MTDRRVGLLLLCAAVGVGATFRAPRVASEVGIYWPDEVFQALEPAHRVVYGYGMIAWEFVEGARSWAFPGLVAGILELLRGMGVDTPDEYLPLVRGFFALLSLLTAVGVYALARQLGGSEPASALAATLYALAAPVLYFSHRALADTVSALPVAFGFVLLLRALDGLTANRRLLAIGAGALLSLSVLLRLHNALFCLAALAWVWHRERAESRGEDRAGLFVPLLLTFGAGALVHGLLDWVTWGRPFHSAIVYLKFNLVEGRSSSWGTSPLTYYLRVFASSMPTVAICLAALWTFAFTGPRRLRPMAPFVIGLGFVVVHSLVPHKELRFILPAFPLLFAATAVGIDQASAMVPRPAVWTLVWGCALSSALLASRLTFGQLGAYEQSRPHASAWDDAGPVNRLLLAAGREPDLCGLKLERSHLAWTGGHAFLHRKVPLYAFDGPPRGSRRFSHVITTVPDGLGTPLAVDGSLGLFRLPVESCDGADGYDWLLP